MILYSGIVYPELILIMKKILEKKGKIDISLLAYVPFQILTLKLVQWFEVGRR